MTHSLSSTATYAALTPEPALPQSAVGRHRLHAPAHPDEIAVVTTRAALADLADDWNALFEHAGDGRQVFQTFDWTRIWAELFATGKTGDATLAIVTMRRAGRLVFVWPLCVERVAGLRQLSFIGAPVSQYSDVLAEHLPDFVDVARAAWVHVVQETRADLAWFAKVRADARIAPVLTAIGAAVTAREEAPYADLTKTPTYAAFETRLTAKARKNQRRHFRRMAERGPMGQEIACQATAADAIDVALVFKRAWLTNRGLVSRAFADPRVPEFFRRAATDGARTGVQVARFMTAGECANAMVTVTAKDRRTVHILAYGLKFERLSPGTCHLELAIRQAIDDRIATFDFLAPRHDYKMDWSDGTIAVEDHTLALSRRGWIYSRVYVGCVREGVKALVRRMPRGVGALIGRLHRRDTGDTAA
jgi:CelD/BcsL family acetyltransferase involved in cellulose biosynthesis